MKHSLPLCFGVAVLSVTGFIGSSARADLIAYEPFDYSVGSTLIGLTGGYGWNGPWRGTGGANSQIIGGNFVYNDGFGNSVSATGNRVHVTGDAFTDGLPGGTGNTSASPYRQLPYAGTTGPSTTWISFLAVRTGQTSTNGYSDAEGPVNYGRAAGVQTFYNATVGNTAQGTEVMSFGRGTANADPVGAANDTWGLVYRGNAAYSKVSNDPWNTASLANSTADFILVRIDHAGGVANPRDDSAYMWINPRLDLEPSLASAALSLLPGEWTDQTPDMALNAIRLFGGNWNTTVGNYGSIQVDEIKLGTAFLDVTIAAIPEPSALALVGVGGLAFIQRLRRKL